MYEYKRLLDAPVILHSSYFRNCQSATIPRLLGRLLVRLPLIGALSCRCLGFALAYVYFYELFDYVLHCLRIVLRLKVLNMY